jgi:enamine deaminase RidA (YjgF/YER057c/UK114 family)
MSDHLNFLSPDTLLKNPAFSQVVVTSGKGKTVYIGGQNAVTRDLETIGKGDITQQTTHALNNVETALTSAEGTLADLFKLSIYIVQGQDLRKGFEGARDFLSRLKNPPVISGIIVAGLANPDYLVEIEAVAFIQEG